MSSGRAILVSPTKDRPVLVETYDVILDDPSKLIIHGQLYVHQFGEHTLVCAHYPVIHNALKGTGEEVFTAWSANTVWSKEGLKEGTCVDTHTVYYRITDMNLVRVALRLQGFKLVKL